MNTLTYNISEYFAVVPERLRGHRLLVWLLFVFTSAVMVYGAGQLKLDNAIESWFDQDDPTFIAYNQYHAQFGSEDGIFIAYKAKDGDVFSEESLLAVKGIQDELLLYRQNLGLDERSPLDHIVRVQTLINTKVLTVDGDILYSKPLVGDAVPGSQKELDEIREIALSQKNLQLQFFSKDFSYGGISIDTDFGAIPTDFEEQSSEEFEMEEIVITEMSLEEDYLVDDEMPSFKPTDNRDYLALNEALTNILNKPEYANHLEYYAVGNTVESEYQQQTQQELGALYLGALLIMVVLLWSLFRSFSAVIWALLIVILTIVWTLGISGFVGLTITPFIVLTAFLLLTIGMADAVHVMSAYLFFRNAGQEHQQASRSAFKKASVPCLLTSITTIIGFAALCFTYIVPVKIVGLMGVIGVAIAFILSMYFLPVMLELWPPAAKSEKNGNRIIKAIGQLVPNFALIAQRYLDKILPSVEKRPVAFVLPFAIILLLCLYGATSSKIDSNVLSLYSEESRFIESIRVIDQRMSGSSSVALYMDFGRDEALKDPEVLKALDALQETLKEKYSQYVVTTSSLVNVVKDTYQKLNEGRESMYVIPDDKSQLAHTLYMFNNANPEERRMLVGDGYRTAAVTITLLDGSSYEYNDAFQSMKDDVNRSLDKIKINYPDAFISVTGTFALRMKVSEYLTATALQSFGIAFLVINILLFLIFGSLKAGLISLIPNLIPSIIVIGLMGLLSIPLDFFAIMLAPIIIGISVDDTIHFLSHYRMQYLENEDIKLSIKNTLKEAGQGVLFTTIILAVGFSILCLSSTPGAVKLGTFGPLAIMAGLLNDLFLLPALIILFKLRFKKTESDEFSRGEKYESV